MLECVRVHIPPGACVRGYTAEGEATRVAPGEHAVHVLNPKLPLARGPVLRFVGGDPRGRDVHVLPGERAVLDGLLVPRANEV